jgi:Domain of unknown function (DUF1707)
MKAVGIWKLLLWLVPLLARQWPRLVEARVGANLAGDRDRERAVATLREQYAGGYLTFDQLTRRIGRAVTARRRRDLRRAVSGLSVNVFDPPVRSSSLELLGQARRAMLVVLTGAYVVFTFTLLLVLGLMVLIQGASTTALVVFMIVWLVPTFLLSRLWRPRRRA